MTKQEIAALMAQLGEWKDRAEKAEAALAALTVKPVTAPMGYAESLTCNVPYKPVSCGGNMGIKSDLPWEALFKRILKACGHTSKKTGLAQGGPAGLAKEWTFGDRERQAAGLVRSYLPQLETLAREYGEAELLAETREALKLAPTPSPGVNGRGGYVARH